MSDIETWKAPEDRVERLVYQTRRSQEACWGRWSPHGMLERRAVRQGSPSRGEKDRRVTFFRLLLGRYLYSLRRPAQWKLARKWTIAGGVSAAKRAPPLANEGGVWGVRQMPG